MSHNNAFTVRNIAHITVNHISGSRIGVNLLSTHRIELYVEVYNTPPSYVGGKYKKCRLSIEPEFDNSFRIFQKFDWKHDRIHRHNLHIFDEVCGEKHLNILNNNLRRISGKMFCRNYKRWDYIQPNNPKYSLTISYYNPKAIQLDNQKQYTK